MEVHAEFISEPYDCAYLPGETAELEYQIVGDASAAEYESRMRSGWRRFGRAWFRPACSTCRRCLSLRVPVKTFEPTRSQRRAWKRNAGEIELTVGPPRVTRGKLALYDRYHMFQADAKGWPWHDPKSPWAYYESFVDNPFPTEEWCFRLEGRLVGVGYVDHLAGGLSAIYFYYEPTLRDRSLGTFNVLSMIRRAADLGLTYVYLGYFVAGCQSLEYKANFRPNQVHHPDGVWRDHR